MFDTIALELMSISGDKDLVAGDLRGNNLADDVAIGKADDETIFRGVIFILRLGDQALPGIIVGFARAATFVFDLVATNAEMLAGAGRTQETQGPFLVSSGREGKGRAANNEMKRSSRCRKCEKKYVPEVGAVLDQLRERLLRDPESAIYASDMVRSILQRLLHLLAKIADDID